MFENVLHDLLSPAALANPHPTLARLRTEAPVFRTYDPQLNSETWLVTRYDDSIALLKDGRFTKNLETKAQLRAENDDAMAGAAQAINKHMLMVDPPDHTRLRNLVHKAFTPRMIDNLAPRIQQIADDLIDKVQAQGTMELIEDFALPLPIIVIAELLGVPLEDRARFRDWSNVIVFEGLGGDQERVATATLEFIMYVYWLKREIQMLLV